MNTDTTNLAINAMLNQQLLIDKLLKRQVITEQEHHSHKRDLDDINTLINQAKATREPEERMAG